MSNVLLVYYSRTGYTASIARQIAHLENWDLDEIRDAHSRVGPFGFVRSLFDVLLGRHPAIEDGKADPSKYDLVVLGASVWMKQLASPMRTYIGRHKNGFRNIAFFCTYGGQGAENAARQCAMLAAKPLTATLAITDNEIEQAAYWPKLDEFIQRLSQAAGNP